MWEPTSEEFNERLCRNYNTSLQQVQKDVEVLREWIRQQPHLPQDHSDIFLTSFLIGCKNRMERAKEKIDNYFTVRLNIPDLFAGVLPDEELSPGATEIKSFPLPRLTPDGSCVNIAALTTDEVQKNCLIDLVKRFIDFGDINIHRQPFIKSHYMVIDCKLATVSHLRWITPTLARDIMYCVQNVFPVVVKDIIVINSPSFTELGLQIMRPFIKNKLLQKIHIHTEGHEVLKKYFPVEILPSDYGGEDESSEKLNESFMSFLSDNKNWLRIQRLITVDEKRRVRGENVRKIGEFYDIHGSFKTLCLD